MPRHAEPPSPSALPSSPASRNPSAPRPRSPQSPSSPVHAATSATVAPGASAHHRVKEKGGTLAAPATGIIAPSLCSPMEEPASATLSRRRPASASTASAALLPTPDGNRVEQDPHRHHRNAAEREAREGHGSHGGAPRPPQEAPPALAAALAVPPARMPLSLSTQPPAQTAAAATVSALSMSGSGYANSNSSGDGKRKSRRAPGVAVLPSVSAVASGDEDRPRATRNSGATTVAASAATARQQRESPETSALQSPTSSSSPQLQPQQQRRRHTLAGVKPQAARMHAQAHATSPPQQQHQLHHKQNRRFSNTSAGSPASTLPPSGAPPPQPAHEAQAMYQQKVKARAASITTLTTSAPHPTRADTHASSKSPKPGASSAAAVAGANTGAPTSTTARSLKSAKPATTHVTTMRCGSTMLRSSDVSCVFLPEESQLCASGRTSTPQSPGRRKEAGTESEAKSLQLPQPVDVGHAARKLSFSEDASPALPALTKACLPRPLQPPPQQQQPRQESVHGLDDDWETPEEGTGWAAPHTNGTSARPSPGSSVASSSASRAFTFARYQDDHQRHPCFPQPFALTQWQQPPRSERRENTELSAARAVREGWAEGETGDAVEGLGADQQCGDAYAVQQLLTPPPAYLSTAARIGSESRNVADHGGWGASPPAGLSPFPAPDDDTAPHPHPQPPEQTQADVTVTSPHTTTTTLTGHTTSSSVTATAMPLSPHSTTSSSNTAAVSEVRFAARHGDRRPRLSESAPTTASAHTTPPLPPPGVTASSGAPMEALCVQDKLPLGRFCTFGAAATAVHGSPHRAVPLRNPLGTDAGAAAMVGTSAAKYFTPIDVARLAIAGAGAQQQQSAFPPMSSSFSPRGGDVTARGSRSPVRLDTEPPLGGSDEGDDAAGLNGAASTSAGTATALGPPPFFSALRRESSGSSEICHVAATAAADSAEAHTLMSSPSSAPPPASVSPLNSTPVATLTMPHFTFSSRTSTPVALPASAHAPSPATTAAAAVEVPSQLDPPPHPHGSHPQQHQPQPQLNSRSASPSVHRERRGRAPVVLDSTSNSGVFSPHLDQRLRGRSSPTRQPSHSRQAPPPASRPPPSASSQRWQRASMPSSSVSGVFGGVPTADSASHSSFGNGPALFALPQNPFPVAGSPAGASAGSRSPSVALTALPHSSAAPTTAAADLACGGRRLAPVWRCPVTTSTAAAAGTAPALAEVVCNRETGPTLTTPVGGPYPHGSEPRPWTASTKGAGQLHGRHPSDSDVNGSLTAVESSAAVAASRSASGIHAAAPAAADCGGSPATDPSLSSPLPPPAQPRQYAYAGAGAAAASRSPPPLPWPQPQPQQQLGMSLSGDTFGSVSGPVGGASPARLSVTAFSAAMRPPRLQHQRSGSNASLLGGSVSVHSRLASGVSGNGFSFAAAGPGAGLGEGSISGICAYSGGPAPRLSPSATPPNATFSSFGLVQPAFLSGYRHGAPQPGGGGGGGSNANTHTAAANYIHSAHAHSLMTSPPPPVRSMGSASSLSSMGAFVFHSPNTALIMRNGVVHYTTQCMPPPRTPASSSFTPSSNDQSGHGAGGCRRGTSRNGRTGRGAGEEEYDVVRHGGDGEDYAEGSGGVHANSYSNVSGSPAGGVVAGGGRHHPARRRSSKRAPGYAWGSASGSGWAASAAAPARRAGKRTRLRPGTAIEVAVEAGLCKRRTSRASLLDPRGGLGGAHPVHGGAGAAATLAGEPGVWSGEDESEVSLSCAASFTASSTSASATYASSSYGSVPLLALDRRASRAEPAEGHSAVAAAPPEEGEEAAADAAVCALYATAPFHYHCYRPPAHARDGPAAPTAAASASTPPRAEAPREKRHHRYVRVHHRRRRHPRESVKPEGSDAVDESVAPHAVPATHSPATCGSDAAAPLAAAAAAAAAAAPREAAAPPTGAQHSPHLSSSSLLYYDDVDSDCVDDVFYQIEKRLFPVASEAAVHVELAGAPSAAAPPAITAKGGSANMHLGSADDDGVVDVEKCSAHAAELPPVNGGRHTPIDALFTVLQVPLRLNLRGGFHLSDYYAPCPVCHPAMRAAAAAAVAERQRPSTSSLSCGCGCSSNGPGSGSVTGSTCTSMTMDTAANSVATTTASSPPSVLSSVVSTTALGFGFASGPRRKTPAAAALQLQPTSTTPANTNGGTVTAAAAAASKAAATAFSSAAPAHKTWSAMSGIGVFPSAEAGSPLARTHRERTSASATVFDRRRRSIAVGSIVGGGTGRTSSMSRASTMASLPFATRLSSFAADPLSRSTASQPQQQQSPSQQQQQRCVPHVLQLTLPPRMVESEGSDEDEGEYGDGEEDRATVLVNRSSGGGGGGVPLMTQPIWEASTTTQSDAGGASQATATPRSVVKTAPRTAEGSGAGSSAKRPGRADGAVAAQQQQQQQPSSMFRFSSFSNSRPHHPPHARYRRRRVRHLPAALAARRWHRAGAGGGGAGAALRSQYSSVMRQRLLCVRINDRLTYIDPKRATGAAKLLADAALLAEKTQRREAGRARRRQAAEEQRAAQAAVDVFSPMRLHQHAQQPAQGHHRHHHHPRCRHHQHHHHHRHPPQQRDRLASATSTVVRVLTAPGSTPRASPLRASALAAANAAAPPDGAALAPVERLLSGVTPVAVQRTGLTDATPSAYLSPLSSDLEWHATASAAAAATSGSEALTAAESGPNNDGPLTHVNPRHASSSPSDTPSAPAARTPPPLTLVRHSGEAEDEDDHDAVRDGSLLARAGGAIVSTIDVTASPMVWPAASDSGHSRSGSFPIFMGHSQSRLDGITARSTNSSQPRGASAFPPSPASFRLSRDAVHEAGDGGGGGGVGNGGSFGTPGSWYRREPSLQLGSTSDAQLHHPHPGLSVPRRGSRRQHRGTASYANTPGRRTLVAAAASALLVGGAGAGPAASPSLPSLASPPPPAAYRLDATHEDLLNTALAEYPSFTLRSESQSP